MRKQEGPKQWTRYFISGSVLPLCLTVSTASAEFLPVTGANEDGCTFCFMSDEVVLSPAEIVFAPGDIVLAGPPPDSSQLTADGLREIGTLVERRLQIAAPVTSTDPILTSLKDFADRYRSSALEAEGIMLRDRLLANLRALHQLGSTTREAKLLLAELRARIITIDSAWLQEASVRQAAVGLFQDLRAMVDTVDAFTPQVFDKFRAAINRIRATAGLRVGSRILAESLDRFDQASVYYGLQRERSEIVLQTQDEDTIRQDLRAFADVQPCEASETRLLAWSRLNDLAHTLSNAARVKEDFPHQIDESQVPNDAQDWIPRSNIDFAQLREETIQALLRMYRTDPALFGSIDLYLESTATEILVGDILEEILSILLGPAPNSESLIIPLMQRISNWVLPARYLSEIGSIFLFAQDPQLRRYAAYSLGSITTESTSTEVLDRLRQMLNTADDEETQKAGLIGLSRIQNVCPLLSDDDRKSALEITYAIYGTPRNYPLSADTTSLVKRCTMISPANVSSLSSGLLKSVKRKLAADTVRTRYRYSQPELMVTGSISYLRVTIDVPTVNDEDRGRRALLIRMFDDVLAVDQDFYAKLILLKSLLTERYIDQSALADGVSFFASSGPIDELHQLMVTPSRLDRLSTEDRAFFESFSAKVTELRQKISHEWLTTVVPGSQYVPADSLKTKLDNVRIGAGLGESAKADLNLDIGDLLRYLEVIL